MVSSFDGFWKFWKVDAFLKCQLKSSFFEIKYACTLNKCFTRQRKCNLHYKIEYLSFLHKQSFPFDQRNNWTLIWNSYPRRSTDISCHYFYNSELGTDIIEANRVRIQSSNMYSCDLTFELQNVSDQIALPLKEKKKKKKNWRPRERDRKYYLSGRQFFASPQKPGEHAYFIRRPFPPG